MEEEQKEKQLKDIITENGLLVSGNGIICENTKKIVEALNKLNGILMHLENKVEALMDNDALQRYERIKLHCCIRGS